MKYKCKATNNITYHTPQWLASSTNAISVLRLRIGMPEITLSRGMRRHDNSVFPKLSGMCMPRRLLMVSPTSVNPQPLP